MANTLATTTNTFSKGLVMDFNPTTVSSNVLVNALNATFLTFNGNEGQLQQDMGNGRVETAYLPEGYIPVGTCEYGDIIYIVSYNPLENKSQIGCFPSPERNISSDEITDLQQSLSYSDFQQTEDGVITGALKSTSVKKIVYGNKNMNPGDKFIIYEEDSSDSGNLKTDAGTLSDYGNTLHTHNEWPKLVKLKVVSIEDSGKIVDLNASVKWYDNDYYLANLNVSGSTSKPDIDSYRSLVSSAYSIFQSKVSGKLAILAELETIEGFSCTYDVFTESTGNNTIYKIYFYTSWETSHNDVNPVGFLFTQSEWTKDSDGGYVYIPEWSTTDNSVIYKADSAQSGVPIKAAITGKIYDPSQIFAYTRTYELENPSADFSIYINEDSYNAKIDEVINWSKAVDSRADQSNLRTITRATRVLEATGEPKMDSTTKQYNYLFNLDSYSLNGDNVAYYTKGIDGTIIQTTPVLINDDVANNYFHKDIPSLITKEFTLPQKAAVTTPSGKSSVDTDLSRMVWNYAIAPVMPYGVLDYLQISGSIDFSKLGTGLVDLNTWKYYNSGNVSTLTWGLEAYAEPNKGIAEVVLDFFDNQGIAASYHITGKTSYSGVFTEQIILGQQNSSYKLNARDAYGADYIHAGIADTNGTIYLTKDNKPTTEKTSYGPYRNDAGALYPNILYLVRITVKYCPKDIIGNYNTDNTSGYKTFYRWYWTNGMFNEMYYNTSDFNYLQPRLGLDFSATFNTKGVGGTSMLTSTTTIYMNSADYSYSGDSEKLYKTLGANVYAINQDYSDDATGNILMTLSPGLSEGFSTFNLNKSELDKIDDLYIRLGKSSITKSTNSPSLVHSGESYTSLIDDNIQPVLADSLCSHEATNGFDRSGYAGYNYGTNQCIISDNLLAELQDTDLASRKTATYYSKDPVEAATGNKDTELYSEQSAYEAYIDSFSLNLVGNSVKFETSEALSYYDTEGNEQTVDHYQYQKISLKDASETGVKLVLAGTAYSKMFASEMKKDSDSKTLRSIIHNATGDYSSPQAAGLHLYNNHLYFNDVITWEMGESGGKSTRWGSYYAKGSTDNKWVSASSNVGGTGNSSHDEWRPSYTNDQVQSLWKSYHTSPISAFMICKSSSSNGKIDGLYSNVSWNKIRSAFSLGSVTDTRIHSNSGKVPGQYPKNDWHTDREYIHSFMVFDQDQNIVVPVADYFVGKSSNITQDKQGGNSPTQTLADMLGSLFAQLYVIDTTATSDSGLLDNFVTLSSYSEYWNKDIVVEVGSLDSIETINKLITIQTQTMEDYLRYLKAHMDWSHWALSYCNDSNVTIELYGTKRAFSFKFEVPYNLGNLVYLNNQKGESSNKIRLSVLSDGNPKVETFSGNITPNTLYTWTGSSVVQFGQGTSMVYATSFKAIDGELYMVAGTQTIKSKSFATIAKCLQYDNGEFSWSGLNQFSTWNSTYNLEYHGTGDDPHLRDLPLISFFNLYKPGS